MRKAICLVLLLVTTGICVEDTFMMGSNNTQDGTGATASCTTKSSSALIWVSDNKIDSEVSTYEPSDNVPNSIDCPFEDTKSNDCLKRNWKTAGWKHINSITDNVGEVILDERWEDLQTIKSNGTITHILDLKSNIFSLPISIRIEKEADIFLCDGSSVHNSNCYWLLLQANNGIISGIRKCKRKTLPTSSSEPITDEHCERISSAINHNVHSSFLDEHIWRHFILERTPTSIMFSSDKRNILEYEDKECNVQHLFIASEGVPGLWKIHDYNFIRHNSANTETTLDPIQSNNIHDGVLCLSMYIKQCAHCALHVKLNANNKIIFKQIFQTSSKKWEKIRFIVPLELDASTTTYPSVYTAINGTLSENENPFWLIDNLRVCQKDEFRSIKTTHTNPKCQLISENEDILSFDNDYEHDLAYDYNFECPTDHIGKQCIPFEHFKNTIYGWSFCERSEGRSTCHCAPGYSGYPECTKRCEKHYYGYGCKKVCNKCDGNCNPISGHCYSKKCKSNYTGDRCDIPPGAYFKYPPIVENKDYSSCTVKMTNLELNNPKNLSVTTLSYYFQYKHALNSNYGCFGNTYSRTSDESESKKNLESDTDYLIRAIVQIDSDTSVYDDIIPFVTCRTSCKVYNESNFQIHSDKDSVTIDIIKNPENCKHTTYRLTLESSEMKIDSNHSRTTFQKSITPYTNYTLNVAPSQGNYFTINFLTNESSPEEIENLEYKSFTNSIQLNWKEPAVTNGIIRKYKVNYWLIKHLECNETTQNNTLTKYITETSINITNLIPHAQYVFQIVAYTISEGPGKEIQVNTTALDNIEDDEFPKFYSNITSEYIINLQFSVNCEHLRGKYVITATAECFNEWINSDKDRIKKKIQNATVENRPNTINISFKESVFAFSNYSITVNMCRNNKCRNFWSGMQQTLANSPSQPSQVEVYSKDEESVSIRWKPPYPPTGIIKEYNIRCKEWATQVISRPSTKCKLWPEFQCATLKNLISNTNYEIEIAAKYEYPSKTGKPETVEALTKVEPSHPPYNISTNWTDNGSLLLSWKHPNISNGPISKFNIYLNNKLIEVPVNEDNYTLLYAFMINSTEFDPSTNYTIQMNAFNGKNGNKSNVIQIPPLVRIPKFEKEPSFQRLNETVKITLQLKLFNNFRLIVNISEEGLSPQLKIVCTCNTTNCPEITTLYIGQNDTNKGCIDYRNNSLDIYKNYKITLIVVTHEFEIITNQTEFTWKLARMAELPDQKKSNLYIWIIIAILILLVVIITIIAIIIIFKKRKSPLLEDCNNSIKDDEIVLTPMQNPNVTLSKSKLSQRIKITELEKYIQSSIANGTLQKQLEQLPHGQQSPWNYADLPQNKPKNRYKNLLAYDHSRVILKKIEGDQYSDYINANYIDGYKTPKAYIATQGPKLATLEDFYRMIWQENVKYIVVMANIIENGKKKVEKYWPDPNSSVTFGNFKIDFISSKQYSNYQHRTFILTHNNNETRKLEQIHFSSWPDHGIPLYPQSLLPFLQKLIQIPLTSKSPIVVHCSAGVGRTGTIILCDTCLRMAAQEGVVDPFSIFEKLRRNRANMVDNWEQYKLAHLVILQCLSGWTTEIASSEMAKTISRIMVDQQQIRKQMQYLRETTWQDEAMHSVATSQRPRVLAPEKDRFPEIIPDIQGQIFLSRSGYINAVSVDGYNDPGGFIVTQQPLPNTLGDFWSMIHENNVTIVVNLNEIIETDSSSCAFWPDKDNDALNPVDYIIVKHKSTSCYENYDLITTILCVEGRDERIVKILSMKNWSPMQIIPNVTDFLIFCEDSMHLTQNANPIVVTCYDGVTACGLFLSSYFIIERIKLEHLCDICHAVRNVRYNRQQFVQTEEQFCFLYRMAFQFINQFQEYSNFK